MADDPVSFRKQGLSSDDESETVRSVVLIWKYLLLIIYTGLFGGQTRTLMFDNLVT